MSLLYFNIEIITKTSLTYLLPAKEDSPARSEIYTILFFIVIIFLIMTYMFIIISLELELEHTLLP